MSILKFCGTWLFVETNLYLLVNMTNYVLKRPANFGQHTGHGKDEK